MPGSRMEPTNDLIHQVTVNRSTIWYNPVGHLLSQSKSTSFSIPLALFAVQFTGTPLAPILATLIPETLTSLAVFVQLMGTPFFVKGLFPAVLVPIMRALYPFTLKIIPVYREAQIDGIFYSHPYVWFEALGPVFLVVIIFFFKFLKEPLMSAGISSFAPFLMLQYVRDGHSLLSTTTALFCVISPLFSAVFTEALRTIADAPKEEVQKGVARFIAFFIFITLISGGLISTNRISSSKVSFSEDIQMFAQNVLTENGVYMANPEFLGPLSYAGVQNFVGEFVSVFNSGIPVSYNIMTYRELSATSYKEAFKKEGVGYLVMRSGEYGGVWEGMTCEKEEYGYKLCRI